MAGPNAFNGVGLNSGEYEWGNDFDLQGYLYNLKSREVRPMTRDFDPSIEEAVWNQANGKIYIMGEDGFDMNLFTLDPKNGRIEKIPTEVDYTVDFSVATRKADWLAYTGMSYTYMGRGYLLDLKNGKSRLIDDPMADTLDGIRFGDWEQWSFTAPSRQTGCHQACRPSDHQ